ncbi:MAG: hypothetical protein AAFY59_10185, partial [Pseudomonadota bacterium]
LACLYILRRKVNLFPDSGIGKVLVVLFLVGPVLTVFSNTEPIMFGVGGLPGLRLHDSFAALSSQLLYTLPFFLGRQFLATESAQRELLRALLIGGMIYSVPMLYEVRMSPVLNTQIYGFFQHNFDQMIRQGGFRPIVFLYHGIWVAFFGLMAVIAAFALRRAEPPEMRMRYLMMAVYLTVVMFLCKTLNVQIYFLLFIPLILFFSQSMQIRVAAVLACMAFTYPLLRGWDLVPVEWLLETAAKISEHRAGSLYFRLYNEGILLEHANTQPFFGWGSWGRNLLYNEQTGEAITVPDGRWIITMGVYGYVGYIVEFGLLSLPLIMLALNLKKAQAAQLSPYIGPLCMILGINMVDMLPNATLISMTWLIAGALLGYAERVVAGLPTRSDVSSEEEPIASNPEPLRPRTVM